MNTAGIPAADWFWPEPCPNLEASSVGMVPNCRLGSCPCALRPVQHSMWQK
jgi:hypothetical protein